MRVLGFKLSDDNSCLGVPNNKLSLPTREVNISMDQESMSRIYPLTRNTNRPAGVHQVRRWDMLEYHLADEQDS